MAVRSIGLDKPTLLAPSLEAKLFKLNATPHGRRMPTRPATPVRNVNATCLAPDLAFDGNPDVVRGIRGAAL
jgi:hypothetical protein